MSDNENDTLDRIKWHQFEWFPKSMPRAPDFWTQHAIRVARHVHDAAWSAVVNWAEECKMTPGLWLKFWEPSVAVKVDPDNPTTLVVSVTAKMRELPYWFEVTV